MDGESGELTESEDVVRTSTLIGCEDLVSE